MPADGTGTGWDTTSPADTDYESAGAQEIRDVRKGVAIRMNKEHRTLGTNSAGGEHVAGSAVAYYQTVAPTGTPSGTALASIDAGRLYFNSSTSELWVWSGVAWVRQTITQSSQLAAGIIQTTNFAAGAVDSNALGAGSVTTAKISNSAVGSAQIAPGSIINTNLAAGSVWATNISNGSVGTAQIATAAVTGALIATNTITGSNISAAAIGSAQIAVGGVQTVNIADTNVSTPKLADAAVTSAKLSNAAVGSTQLAPGAVLTTNLADGSVTPAKLGTGALQSCGTYTGNGSATGPTVTLGFAAKVIHIYRVGQLRFFVGLTGQTTLLGTDNSGSISTGISITSTTFQITTTNAAVNTNAEQYFYIAFG